MATQVDILVGIHRIVEVQRTQYVVSVQTFARRLDFAPRFVPLNPSKRIGPAGLILTLVFVVGVIECAWLVLR